MNIVFFGTPDFVLPIPAALLTAKDCQLSCIVTNPDRPVGRKQILTPSPVKKWALANKTPVYTPEKLDENFKSSIINHKSLIGILAAYGKIIPQTLIDAFPKGILVVHPSLLPKYRGASPVQAAILAGDKETGVTIIKMDEKLDHGPIVSQFKDQIRPDETPQALYERLFQEAAEVLVAILPDYIKGKIELREQDHSQATYTKILKKKDGFIDLENPPPAQVFERMVRAYHPWPGVWTLLRPLGSAQGFGGQAKRLKILKAHLEEGKLVLDQVQLEGKNPVSGEQFSQAYPEVKF